MVSLMRRKSGLQGQGLTGPVVVKRDKDRQALREDLTAGLAQLAARASRDAVQVLEVQLVVQVCAAPSYADWKAQREQAWRKQRADCSTASWPANLGEGAVAALLLPLAAGRVGLAVGKFPRMVATPLFAAGQPGHDHGDEDLALGLITRWVGNPGAGMTARLAPPVIETIQRNRVVDRRLAPLGQTWPLPAPDGL